MIKKVGEFKENVIQALNLEIKEGTSILLGDTNIEHMLSKHKEIYLKYHHHISTILEYPDYVGKHKENGSIEYVKEIMLDKEYVKIAVRISTSGKYFARSMYVLNHNRVKNFIKKGTLVPLTNKNE